MAVESKTVRNQVIASLGRRRTKERLFRGIGLVSILTGLAFLVFFLVSILRVGTAAFVRVEVMLPVSLYAQDVDPLGDGSLVSLAEGNYARVVRDSLVAQFPEADTPQARRALSALLSLDAPYIVRDWLLAHPDAIGKQVLFSLPASAAVDQLLGGDMSRDLPAHQRLLSDQQIRWVDTLVAREMTASRLNSSFFTNGDSREPELAGIRAAFVGSVYMLLVTFVLAVPLGVAAALYLEEFAPRNRLTTLVEININNLASVPSVIFGLLGLAILINFAGFARSTPLVGGIVLSLLTLPVVIIAARAAISAVPASIRDAALAVGASPTQVVLHHVLPTAAPGIMTGSIIGMARALGETAPLLMIGMVAFVVDVPASVTSASTALPVQIYLWADSPERAFLEKTAAAIIVLLGFLLLMNLLAVLLRRHFERSRQ